MTTQTPEPRPDTSGIARADVVLIYGLSDPRTPDIIRYIGQTKTPRNRHIEHCSKVECSKKGIWIESIRMEGYMPKLTILEVVHKDDALAAEGEWITNYPKDQLTNTTVSLKYRSRPIAKATPGEIFYYY